MMRGDPDVLKSLKWGVAGSRSRAMHGSWWVGHAHHIITSIRSYVDLAYVDLAYVDLACMDLVCADLSC
ncbi:hypothetical protein [Magnetovibrio blakemorei]|uniref:Uncharacterized protein n=1 Tax=Magnetovibrio blakemorei TaxID=28181 RepID=A0A1E5Q6E2_9PROT|nr:hypothetical protein [Magnetovibrio blakemorei]OEJ66519.1 hypothetical protein BEN30_12075 [Magnetovibrio blakemorei]